MPRRRQQQYRRPPRRTIEPDDWLAAEALNRAARRLSSNYTLPELQSLVTQTREARDWADQQAQQQPSPEALRRFRAAAQQLAEAERALGLAGDVVRDPR